ncbi:MAG: T9SS type A sorting domain-containing protein [Bacteroidetes bacterium]|nr:T9SS type A sorting domain-containing protein [Bacteroidota bacterium]
MKQITISLFAVILVIVQGIFFRGEVNHTPLYCQRNDEFTGPKSGIAPAIERYNLLRKNIKTGKVEINDLVRSRMETEKFRKSVQKKTTGGTMPLWEEMGPDNIGGRTRAILFDRNNPQRIYAGSVSGGLWISDNGGISWYKWEPQNDLAWMPVTTIVQSPDNSIYAGTGENFGIGCTFCPNGIINGNTMFPGTGVWKSTDGGETFLQLNSTIPDTNYQGDWSTIQRLAVDPVNPQRIYAAIYRGIRISDDGGNSWNNPLLNPAGIEITTQAYDVKVTSEGLVFASVGTAPYYSPDGNLPVAIDTIVSNNSNAEIKFTTPHNFSVNQLVTITGPQVSSSYMGRQKIKEVISAYNIVLDVQFDSSYNQETNGNCSSWIKINENSQPEYNMNTSGASRVEFGVSSTNPEYIYCSVSDLAGDPLFVYKSTDRGKTWSDLLINQDIGQQGEYNNVITGFPDDPDNVLIGYVWCADNSAGAWTYHSVNYDVTGDGTLYTHADKHTIVFHPNYLTSQKKEIFYGTDGGIFRSRMNNGLRIFQSANRNYSTVQFYGLAIGPKGEVFGGTQDNGNPFIDPNNYAPQPTPRSMVWQLEPSGDGGYGEISVINPDAFIFESQYGAAYRTPVRGKTPGSSFYASCDQDDMNGLFVTPFLLWESFNDTASNEYIAYITDSNEWYNAGDFIYVKSRNNKKVFKSLTDVPVAPLDTILIKDVVQSKFFIVLHKINSNGAPINFVIWMSKDILDFSVAPSFQKIFELPGYYNEAQLEISTDGKHLFASKENVLYRVDGIEDVVISIGGGQCSDVIPPEITLTQLKSFAAIITDIAVNPEDANDVVIALGQYGFTDHIYRTDDALSAMPLFENIQGASSFHLPSMPVYSVLIEKHDRNRIFAGTEYGIYFTENGFETNPAEVKWIEQNSGMSLVPVYRIRQQAHEQYVETVGPTGVENEGVIYIATHGRGIFKCTTYADTILTVKEQNPAALPGGFRIFPNPVTEYAIASFETHERGDVSLEIYSITGKKIKNIFTGRQETGEHSIKFSAEELTQGAYFIKLTTRGKYALVKMIKVM